MKLKVAVACDSCRARKVKCNGARPVCDVCERRKTGVPCSYGGKRLATTEVAGSAKSRHYDSGHQFPRSGASAPNIPRGRGSASASPGACRVAVPASDEITGSGTELPTSGDGVDSMIGAIGHSSNTPEFFGNSSAGSFMRQIQAGIDSQLNQPPGNTNSEIGLGGPPPAFDSQEPEFHYVLPPRKTADYLVQNFWEFTSTVYPFLDQASFEEDYQALWNGSHTRLPERSIVAIVNIVFALGTQVSAAVLPELRQKTAKAYYDQTQSALSGISWDTSSIDLVSCLLLTGVFLQTTNRPQRCWMVVGYAIRMAESLGLHLPESSLGAQSRRETEVARRVWHGCVLMDRVLAMTFGRPVMISKSLATAVPLPLEIDHDFLDTQEEGSALRPDGSGCQMSFYVFQLQFYEIINDILLNMYMTGGEQQHSTDEITSVLRLDNALLGWNQSLPEHLREPDSVCEKNMSMQRLPIINKIRFLHGRILLFRPMVAQFCLQQQKNNMRPTWVDSIAQRTIIECSRLCLKDSVHLIDMVSNYLDFDTVLGPLPSWWYCVLYVYTAATVLLAERLQPVIAETFPDFSADVSWKRAIDLLSAYARAGDSAKRCVKVLETLSTRILRSTCLGEPEQYPATEPRRDSVVPFSFEFFHDDFGLYGDDFNLDDMSWLNSLPSNL